MLVEDYTALSSCRDLDPSLSFDEKDVALTICSHEVDGAQGSHVANREEDAHVDQDQEEGALSSESDDEKTLFANLSTENEAQAMASTQNISFRYTPLQSGQIRLMRLLPGTSLRCEMISSTTDADYDALSYCWGSPPSDSVISINGQDFKIRKNLLRLLQRLKTMPDRWYWADALCIDQSDNVERTHQVGSMDKIYKQARRVIAWLGPSHHGSERLLMNAAARWTTRRLYAMAHLCHRPYWTRLWIFQEVILARELTVLCGATVLQLDIVQRLIGELTTTTSSWLLRDHDVQKIRDSPALALLQSIAAPAKTLYDLIIQTGRLECADPHDKIYALLAIANDGILPDYNKPMIALLHEVLRRFHTHHEPGSIKDFSRDLQGLIAAVFGPSHEAGTYVEMMKFQASSLSEAFPLLNDPVYNIWWASEHGHRHLRTLLFAEMKAGAWIYQSLDKRLRDMDDSPGPLSLLDRQQIGHLPQAWLWIILNVDRPDELLWTLNHAKASGRVQLRLLEFICSADVDDIEERRTIARLLFRTNAFAADGHVILEHCLYTTISKKIRRVNYMHLWYEEDAHAMTVFLLESFTSAAQARYVLYIDKDCQPKGDAVNILHLAILY